MSACCALANQSFTSAFAIMNSLVDFGLNCWLHRQLRKVLWLQCSWTNRDDIASFNANRWNIDGRPFNSKCPWLTIDELRDVIRQIRNDKQRYPNGALIASTSFRSPDLLERVCCFFHQASKLLTRPYKRRTFCFTKLQGIGLAYSDDHVRAGSECWFFSPKFYKKRWSGAMKNEPKTRCA